MITTNFLRSTKYAESVKIIIQFSGVKHSKAKNQTTKNEFKLHIPNENAIQNASNKKKL